MRARSLFLAVAALSPFFACSSGTPGAPGTLAPSIIVPDDLIGQIATYQLKVYAATGGLGCDTATGEVTGNVASAMTLASTSNISASCSGGVTRCATVTVPQSSTGDIFAVTGFAPGGTNKVAVGCAEATVGMQSSLSVSIKLVHFVPPAMCGDGTVEPTETCDDSTQSCVKCQTVEELLSYGDPAMAGTQTGSSGQKTNPFFLWSANSGPAGELLAVFTDVATPTGMPQITARIMDPTLAPSTAHGGSGSVVSESSIFLPNSSTFPPTATGSTIKEPWAASIGTTDYVVFADNDASCGSDPFCIHFHSFDQSSLVSPQTGVGCKVNDASGSVKALPSVAAGSTSLFAAWQDASGNVAGRTITPNGGCGTLGTQATLGSGAGGTTGPRVAAAGSGWAVVWANGSNITLQLVDSTGKPSGGSKTVGSGSTPAIASAPGGSSFAVAWAASGGIKLQRYKSDGSQVSAGDATVSVNTAMSDSVATPAIAGGSQAGGFFAVTWVDATTQSVMSRLVSATTGQLTDNTAYLFNTIDGQAGDFQVNVNTGRSPANPTVAVGGSGPFIAYGWEDKGASCPKPTPFPGAPCWGIVARRFPAPTM